MKTLRFKTVILSSVILVFAACGGSKKETTESPNPPEPAPTSSSEQKPEKTGFFFKSPDIYGVRQVLLILNFWQKAIYAPIHWTGIFMDHSGPSIICLHVSAAA